MYIVVKIGEGAFREGMSRGGEESLPRQLYYDVY